MRFPLAALFASLLALALPAPAAWADAADAWGQNYFGQIGDGTYDAALSPTNPPAVLASGVTVVTAGDNHSMAIKNGTVYVWGGWLGVLGNGTMDGSLTPVPVPGMTGVNAIAAGNGYCLAANYGVAYQWGNNYDFAAPVLTTPQVVPGLPSGISAVAAGGQSFNLAIRDGAVWGWGGNFSGQAGDGTTLQRSSAVQAKVLTSGVTRIAAGFDHCLAIRSGTLYAWGANDLGQVGNGAVHTIESTPLAITGMTSGVTDIACGFQFSLALKGGNLYAWGSNYDLGTGTGSHITPTLVPGLPTITQIAAGNASWYALASDGSLWVYGSNVNGELGTGDTENRYTPTRITAPAGYIFTSIDADSQSHHAVATLAPIPEPASLALFATAAAFLLLRRRP
jgi:alpha-tubulin suppressor-like RCC1 family protein